MPTYAFECNKCNNKLSSVLKIAEFQRQMKEDEAICQMCGEGIMVAVLFPVAGNIERRKDEIVEQITEEARQIVERIKNGDAEAIADIYGDTPNPTKQHADIDLEDLEIDV